MDDLTPPEEVQTKASVLLTTDMVSMVPGILTIDGTDERVWVLGVEEDGMAPLAVVLSGRLDDLVKPDPSYLSEDVPTFSEEGASGG